MKIIDLFIQIKKNIINFIYNIYLNNNSLNNNSLNNNSLNYNDSIYNYWI